MKKQSDSDSDVKCATIQFHGNSHNSQSDYWIGLNLCEPHDHVVTQPTIKIEI
jgi:hypothetical protein